MQRVDFFKLSREKQERFIASTKGNAPPAPIASRLGPTRRAMVFAGIALFALLALVVLVAVGYGSLESALAVHKAPVLAAYALLVFLMPFGALRALAATKEATTLPYKPGVYLFPMCVIDARTSKLGVANMADLDKTEAATAGGALLVAFRGAGAYAFPAGDAESARQLNQQLDIARENVKHALATKDESELVTLDPLYEAKKGWASPIGPKEPLSPWNPPWKKLTLVIAAAAALVLGPLLWVSRNAASEDAMLKRANAKGTPDAYRAYLALGTRHADDVSRVLLPRAELKDAQAKGTVDAIQAFLASHPSSAIDAEAQAALHDAYARELDKAKMPGTLSALAAFVKQYPKSGLDQDVAKARHDLFAAALEKYKKRASSKDALAFVPRLLSYLESHGPTVRVAFSRELSSGLERADKIIGASPLNKGLGTLQVTRHFDGKAPPVGADALAKAFGETWDDVFPTDMLAFAPSESTEGITEPAIVLRYRVTWLGIAYSSATLKRAFAGVTFSGEALASIPGDPSPYRIKVDVGPPRALLVEYTTPAHAAFKSPGPPDNDAPEPSIYATQELRGLDLAAAAVDRAFFNPKPDKP